MGKIKRVYQGGVLYDLEDPEIRALLGSLTDLDTEDKSSIVAAVNEIVKNLGVKSYSDLSNKPTINGVVLSGNKTNKDLGLADPSDAQVATAVSTWLGSHPEATTTVEDGSITYEKLHPNTISQLSEDMANGLTDAEKALMLSLFKAAAYTENVSAKVTQLEALWSGSGDDSGDDSGGSEGGGDSGGGDTQTYTVTNNLTNVTNSNSATTASGYYSATLSIEDGYEYTKLSITMGGTDITDSVYGDGSILITDVTGDIVITASAQLIGLYPVYQLAQSATFDGTNTVDTGYALFDKGDDKDWTLLLDFTSSVRPGRVITSGTTTVFSMASESYYWFVYYGSNKWNKISNASNGVKLAITHVAGSKTLTFYYLDSDVVASESLAGQNTADTKLATTCVLGGIPDGKAAGFTGTIDTCEIYERILSADEISDFMGVA